MPNRHWVGGTGNWDSTTTANWSATSGGPSGASVPTAADDVFIDANSGAVTVTKTTSTSCLTLTFTGFTGTWSIANGITLTVVGTSITLGSGMTYTQGTTGILSTVGSQTAITITFAGITIPRLNCGISTGGTQTITVNGTTPTIRNLNVSNISIVSLAGTALDINQSLSVTGVLIGTAFNITGGGTVSITCVSPQASTIRNGFTVTTGTTLSMSTSLEINGGTITFNINSFLTTNSNTLRLQGTNAITLNTSVVTWFDINNLQSSTTTLTSDLNVSNNFIIDSLSGFTMVGSGGTRNINCTGGFSQRSGVTFTTTSITVNLIGTGIWDAQVSSIISNGVFVINTSNPSGYTIGSASRNIHYFLNSTITLIGSSVVNVLSGHTLRIQGTCTLSTNNTGSGGTQIIWRNLTFASFPNAGILVLNNDTTFTGNVTGTNSSTATINGSKLLFEGNLDAFGAIGTIGGTSTLEFSGSSNVNWVTGTYQSNIIINKTGNITATGTVTWGFAGRTLQRTAGNISAGTITIPAVSCIINNMIFNNLTITSGATITQNVLNTINGILQFNGNATFAGTAGWTCATLLNTTNNSTITLQNSVTYRTTTGVQLVSSISTQPITMQSVNLSIRAIWTLDYGATQNIIYVNGTRIDSSLGQPIWTFGGLISNTPLGAETLNWRTGTRPGTIAYVFLN